MEPMERPILARKDRYFRDSEISKGKHQAICPFAGRKTIGRISPRKRCHIQLESSRKKVLRLHLLRYQNRYQDGKIQSGYPIHFTKIGKVDGHFE
jgi:hypothetical protein